MSWLAPLGFLGLLGLVALIIIYIIKPNYQNKIISSTFIWKLSLKLRKKQIPISKLRNIILFICQVLAICAFTFILARPVIAAEKEETVSEKIVILDASVSMLTEYSEQTRFDRAVADIRAMADEVFLTEERLTVILAGEKATILSSGVTAANSEVLYEALDDLVDPSNDKSFITYGEADIAGAIKLAEETTSENPETEVILYTDTKYIDKGKVIVKDVTLPEEWNASILDVRAILDENYYRFEVDVAVYGNVDRDVEVFIDILGTNDDKSTITINGLARCLNGETTTIVFAKLPEGLTLDEAGIQQEVQIFSYENATIRIEEKDCFKYDNSFELLGGLKPSLRIQYASSTPNNFFATSLLVLSDTLSKHWNVEFVEVKKDEEPASEGFDVYIFEHTMPKKIPEDGVLILANPDSLPTNIGIKLGNAIGNGKNDINLSAGDASPLMKGITPENITVSYAKEIKNADGYTPLMYCNSSPVVMAKNEPDQKIVVMSFSLNYSNFSMLLDFPLFMYNIFKHYVPSTITEYAFEVHDEITLNSRSEMLTIKDQNGNETIITEFPTSMALKTPGRYTVTQVPISGIEVEEYFYVKMPEAECNISAEVDVLTNPYFAIRDEMAAIDLLMYFALSLVALLFFEWWLQSRDQF